MADMETMPVEMAEDPAADRNSVTLTKNPDGTFACNGEPAATLDEALEMARAKLGGEQADGMSPEQAFEGGFEEPMGGLRQMRGGY